MKMPQLYFLSTLYILFVLIRTSNAQIGPILKNIAKNSAEKSAIEAIEITGKNSIKVFDDITRPLLKLSLSENLKEGYNENIRAFHESKEIRRKYISEIENSTNYLIIKDTIGKILENESIQDSILTRLLLGESYNGMSIDSNTLYNLYFYFSNKFAKDELQKLILYYNCNPSEFSEIKEFATKSKISFDQSICKAELDKSEDFGIIEIIF